MDREIVIKAENVIKKFGDRTVLSGISLDVYRGETFVIMGGSGCGKSTFLRHLIGALKPDLGRVSLLGKDLSKLGEDELDAVNTAIERILKGGTLVYYEGLRVQSADLAVLYKRKAVLESRIARQVSGRPLGICYGVPS